MRSARTICLMVLLLLSAAPLLGQVYEKGSLKPSLKTATDLAVPAGAISLRIQRRLLSKGTQSGLLGARWQLNWESRLSRNLNRATIEDWTGAATFTKDAAQPDFVNSAGERLAFTRDGRATRTGLDGQSETFDAQGKLIERRYHHGNKVSLSYAANGRLARIDGPGGAYLQFATDSLGRLIQVKAASGVIVRYGYEADNLSEVQINQGPVLRYGYNAKGALIRVEDPQTGLLEITYDSRERVTAYRQADGSEQRFEYDEAANSEKRIDPNRATTITRESLDKRRLEITDALGNRSSIEFEKNGRPQVITGPSGASSHLTYDSMGRMSTSVDALGRTTRFEYSGTSAAIKAIVRPDGVRQEFEYDELNNLVAVRIAGRLVSSLSYNPDGSIATMNEPGAKEQKFAYYQNGLIKSVVNALGETTQYEYDARGNLIRETNPLGGATRRDYDSQDRLVTVTDPGGAVTQYEYDERGRLIKQTAPAGAATSFEYDAKGRLVSETDPAGQTKRYEYTAVDRIAKVISTGNRVESFAYDLAGNLIERKDRFGLARQYEYDALGHVTKERHPGGLEMSYRYDAAGQLLGIEDNNGAKEEYQVDIVGRLTQQSDAAGAKTKYQFDQFGDLLTVTDASDGIKQFRRGADGRLTEVKDASGDEAIYEYDAAGRLTASHRPSGGVSRFTYDSLGNLLTTTDPLGNKRQFSYDSAGRQLSATDAIGRTIRYVYGKDGRLSEKQLPDGKKITLQYDLAGRITESNDGEFPIHRAYDPAGNLISVEYAALKKTIAYEYDALGLRTRMIMPDGRKIGYEYNALKQLAAIVLPDTKRIAFAFDQKDRLKSVTYPNGVTGVWTYEATGQTAKISYRDTNGSELTKWVYSYNQNGNASERQDTRGQTTRFAYDAVGQLTEESNAGSTIKYHYGAGGNRTTVEEGAAVRQFKHDAADRLVVAGTEQLAYDGNGNLISRTGPQVQASAGTNYDYDAENRLVKVVTADGATTTFGYAPSGERAWRRDKGGVTYFIYDGPNLIAELDKDLRTRTTYIHGFGIDRPLAMLQEKQSYYYHTDRAGSVTQLSDSKGNVAAAYNYDAFGRIRTRQGTVANPFTYTGRELDPTGLYYYRARYYDAGLGRFISNDLVAARLDEPLEQNPYLYVRNNPLRYVDPLGLDGLSPEYLNGQSNQDLIYLFRALWTDEADQRQVYDLMKARGIRSLGSPELDRYYSFRPQAVVGRPGVVGGGANLNPAQTGVAPVPRGGATVSAPMPQANPAGPVETVGPGGPVRPQPGPAGGDTLVVEEPQPGGNTLVEPASGGRTWADIWNRGLLKTDPNYWAGQVRTSISGIGTAASVITAVADCYRNGLASCGTKAAVGIAIGGVVRVIVGTASGPILTILSGGKAWWEIRKELNTDVADRQQREQQEQARKDQETANLKNKEGFYSRIELLKAKISAAQKQSELITKNSAEAAKRLKEAKDAANAAEYEIRRLRNVKHPKDDGSNSVCNQIYKGRSVRAQLEGLAGTAESLQQQIEAFTNQARPLATSCESTQDAQALRKNYSDIRSLVQRFSQARKDAEEKNSFFTELKDQIAPYTSPGQAVATTDIADRVRDAEKAASAATDLLTPARDAARLVSPALPQLRREINGLQAAAPEALLAQIQDQINELHSLLSAIPAPEIIRYDEQADTEAGRARQYREEALRLLETSSGETPCDVLLERGALLGGAEAAMQRIRNASVSVALADPRELLTAAAACEASAKCIPLINQSRQLFEQLQIENGDAAMTQAQAAGCNVEGLVNSREYYTSVRDAVNLLNNGKTTCNFQATLDFAQKIPAGIQNRPQVAQAMRELRAGLQAEQHILELIEKADQTNDIAAAKSYVAEARRVATPYPCLANSLERKGSTDKPADEEAPEAKLTAPSDSTPPGEVSGAETSDANNSPAKRPARRRSNPAPAEEETPEDNTSPNTASKRPARRANNPAPSEEETPDDDSSTKTPERRRTNQPTTDEETPDDSGRTKTAGTQPARRGATGGQRSTPPPAQTAGRRTPAEGPARKPAAGTAGGKTYQLVGIEVYRRGYDVTINQRQSDFFGAGVRSFEVGYDRVASNSGCPGGQYGDHVLGVLDVEVPASVTIGQPVSIKATMRGQWSRECTPPGYDTDAALAAQAMDPKVRQEWKGPGAFGVGRNQGTVTSTITYSGRLVPIPSYGDEKTVPRLQNVVFLFANGELDTGRKRVEVSVNFIFQ